MLICGLRAIHSVWRNQLVIVFEDTCLNGVQFLWGGGGAPGLMQFWVHYFFLFSYVNDLRTVVKQSQMNMYADDTELHLNGHDLLSVQHGFQCNLDTIQAWLCVNRFQLDASKSVVMLIDARKKISHPNVTVHISG